MTRVALAAFLVVLSTVLVPVGVVSTWLSLRVDDTDKYVETVAPLADDEELRDALAEQVSAAAVGTLERRVPAALLPDSLGTVVRAAADRVVENDGFPEFWRKANAKAHREFLAIVHDREGVVADGWVFIDLGPLLDEVIADLALPGIQLPPQKLMVPVVPESELEKARGGYQVLDWLSVWVPIIWLVLMAIAIAVAPGWRGRLRAAASGAIGAAVGSAVVLLVAAPTTDLVVDQVEPENQDLARLVIEVVVQTLDETAITVAIVGLVAGVALLCGSFLPRVVSRP